MKKLTDSEFKAITGGLNDLRANRNSVLPLLCAVEKLLANYQEQLEAESYVKLERYTEANCATTELCVEVEP